MVQTYSTMALTIGSQAPPFSLPDTEGRTVSLDQFAGKPALLVAFICNHCPFVKHVRGELARLAREYQAKGVGIVGVSSNDVAAYPDDAPAKMKDEARAAGYVFP